MSQPKPTTSYDTCDHERLEKFLQSDHYRIEDEEMIAHLDWCTACREKLEAQAGDERSWKSAAALLKPNEFDSSSTAIFSAASGTNSNSLHAGAIQDVLKSLAPTDDPHRLGRIGNYEVVGVVGVGAMGVVLKAIDPSLDRVVAVKVMAPRLANNEMARKRFSREAKAAAAVLHPNVIPIHSVSSNSTLPYLVMTYVRGGSLQKRLDDEGHLPLVEVLRIGSQIAAGLSAAHEQGLVHRDIKPENILLDEGVERVSITDFGLARAVDDNTMTQQGTIAGTPMYMSPEQARGEQVDQQSDLFSLGSVLYALCTGKPPYKADSSYGVMRRIIDESPTPIRELNPEIPAWFASIVERLMAKEKSNRFATAIEVNKLLEACLSHVQQPTIISLPDIPHSIRLPNQPKNKGLSLMTKLSAGTLVVALIAITYSQFFYTPHTTQGYSNLDPQQEYDDTDFDMTSLSVDLAERLIGRMEHVTFPMLTTVTPEVAAVLANHPGNLNLPAIREISPEVAKAFAQKKKELWITLRGLKDITPETASELGKATCALELGITSLTVESAHYLAQTKGTLKLGLTSITPEVAAILAIHEGWLSLNSLRTIDPQSAAWLATHGHWLTLNGLIELTPEIAKGLASFDGDTLDMNGLNTIELDSARLLSQGKYKSGLYLNGLQTVSSEVVEVLANGKYNLSFQGLTTVDTKTQLALVAAQKQLKDARKLLMVPKEFLPASNASVAINNELFKSQDEEKSIGMQEAEVAYLRKVLANPEQYPVVKDYTKDEMEAFRLRVKERETSLEVAKQKLELNQNSDDQKNVQGKWNITEHVSEGNSAPKELLERMHMEFDGKNMTMEMAGCKTKFTYKLDPSTSPKSIDIVFQGKTLKGTYEFKGDTLHIRASEQPGDRPTPMKTEPNTESIFTLVRAKDQAVSKNDDEKNIQGTWQATYSEDSGRVAPQESLKDIQFVFEEGGMTMHLGTKRFVATYLLNSNTSPKEIDWIEKGITKKGIYDLQGDTLRICFAEQSKARPTAFDSKPNSANDILIQMKRQMPGHVGLPEESYSGDQLDVKKAVLNKDGKLEINYSTLIESMYYCPGANSKMTEQGLELVFVRSLYNKKEKVDHPVNSNKQFGGTITVDPQSKPVYVRSGDKLQKIWDPKGNQGDGKTSQNKQDPSVNVADSSTNAQWPEENKNMTSPKDADKILEQQKPISKLSDLKDGDYFIKVTQLASNLAVDFPDDIVPDKAYGPADADFIKTIRLQIMEKGKQVRVIDHEHIFSKKVPVWTKTETADKWSYNNAEGEADNGMGKLALVQKDEGVIATFDSHGSGIPILWSARGPLLEVNDKNRSILEANAVKIVHLEDGNYEFKVKTIAENPGVKSLDSPIPNDDYKPVKQPTTFSVQFSNKTNTVNLTDNSTPPKVGGKGLAKKEQLWEHLVVYEISGEGFESGELIVEKKGTELYAYYKISGPGTPVLASYSGTLVKVEK